VEGNGECRAGLEGRLREIGWQVDSVDGKAVGLRYVVGWVLAVWEVSRNGVMANILEKLEMFYTPRLDTLV